jgi:hypothetical protein
MWPKDDSWRVGACKAIGERGWTNMGDVVYVQGAFPPGGPFPGPFPGATSVLFSVPQTKGGKQTTDQFSNPLWDWYILDVNTWQHQFVDNGCNFFPESPYMHAGPSGFGTTAGTCVLQGVPSSSLGILSTPKGLGNWVCTYPKENIPDLRLPTYTISPQYYQYCENLNNQYVTYTDSGDVTGWGCLVSVPISLDFSCGFSARAPTLKHQVAGGKEYTGTLTIDYPVDAWDKLSAEEQAQYKNAVGRAASKATGVEVTVQ